MGGGVPPQAPPWIQCTGLSVAHSLPPPRICVCARTQRHTCPHTDVPTRSHTRTQLTCPHAHTLSRSHQHPLHASQATGTRSEGPSPLPGEVLCPPQKRQGKRLTGGGQVCTDMGDCTSESQWERGDKTGTSRGGRAGRGAAPAAKPLPVRGPGVSASLPFLPSFQEALRTSLRIRRKKRGRRRWRRTEPQEEGRKEEAA